MKKYLLLLLAFFLFVPSLIADDMKDRKKMSEEIQKFKIDYLAKEMGLSEAEKAKFEPIYNEYDEARRKAGAEAWRFERKLKKEKNASEDDYKKLSELQQETREKINDIDKEYNKKFESFLTSKQIYQMHQGEEKFFSKMKETKKKHKRMRNRPKDKE